MKLIIDLPDRHVELFKRFASMRRTLSEAVRLIDDYNSMIDDFKHLSKKNEPMRSILSASSAAFERVQDATLANVRELMDIIPAIEAAQFAIRDGEDPTQPRSSGLVGEPQ